MLRPPRARAILKAAEVGRTPGEIWPEAPLVEALAPLPGGLSSDPEFLADLGIRQPFRRQEDDLCAQHEGSALCAASRDTSERVTLFVVKLNLVSRLPRHLLVSNATGCRMSVQLCAAILFLP
jgi:hypothetical protein